MSKKAEKADGAGENRPIAFNQDVEAEKKLQEAKKHCDEVKAAWDRWSEVHTEYLDGIQKLYSNIASAFKMWSGFNKALLDVNPSGRIKSPLSKAILPPRNFYIFEQIESPLVDVGQTTIMSAALMIKLNEVSEKEEKPL